MTKSSSVLLPLPVIPRKPTRLPLFIVRLILFSTDCVFSGVRGNYSEKDSPDAEDIYGYSKLLGEVKNKHSMTIRCSIIGHEIQSKNGLLEWFLSKKKVSGFTRVIFTGLTTLELGKIILKIINKKI